jgi:hypothetical protein
MVALTQRLARQAGQLGAEGTHHFQAGAGVSGQWVLLHSGILAAPTHEERQQDSLEVETGSVEYRLCE